METRIKTIQISVPIDIYKQLKEKKGNRPWLSFIYDNIDTMV